jgi:ferritin-like metal-binding protein YciE
MLINNLPDKFLMTLAKHYALEQRLLGAIDQMVEQSNEPRLKQGLQAHREETQQQIANLEQAFSLLGQEPPILISHSVEGLIQDAQELLNASANNPLVLDCAIADAQLKVEHLEVACYRALIIGAETLDKPEIVSLLQQNLQQEEKTAQLLEQMIPELTQTAAQQAADVA